MYLRLMPEVFTLFPGVVQYTIVCKGVDNHGDCPDLEKRLREAEAKVRSDDSFADIKAHPQIANWREAFTSFGINPNQCPPSVANLIKRTRAGKDLPFINKLVCLFNIISLTYVIPAGGDDIDCLKGDLHLGPAAGDEIYMPLGGGNNESPKPGEIILYDSASKLVFCRAWCWKNGDPSKITPDSTNVSINLDILAPASVEKGAQAAEEVVELVRRYCGGDIVLHKLDAANPEIAL